MLYKTNYKSPLGDILIASDGENIVGLWFFGQKYFSDTVPEEMVEKDNLKAFKDCKKWLDDYFAGRRPKPFEVPLSPRGGEFRQTVWKLLREIPFGETTTYAILAKKTAEKLGKDRMSAQAVGGAVAHNPISIIIPCHRVVGSNGDLTGYAGGLDKKRALLKLEQETASMSK